MIGVDLPMPQGEFRGSMLKEYGVLTGMAGTHTLRLLPALNITRSDCDRFLEAFHGTMKKF
jgi:acetylornithine aminotransferase